MVAPIVNAGHCFLHPEAKERAASIRDPQMQGTQEMVVTLCKQIRGERLVNTIMPPVSAQD